MDENERKKGMNQGIWLAVQELAHAGRWTQAAKDAHLIIVRIITVRIPIVLM